MREKITNRTEIIDETKKYRAAHQKAAEKIAELDAFRDIVANYGENTTTNVLENQTPPSYIELLDRPESKFSQDMAKRVYESDDAEVHAYANYIGNEVLFHQDAIYEDFDLSQEPPKTVNVTQVNGPVVPIIVRTDPPK